MLPIFKSLVSVDLDHSKKNLSPLLGLHVNEELVSSVEGELSSKGPAGGRIQSSHLTC